MGSLAASFVGKPRNLEGPFNINRHFRLAHNGKILQPFPSSMAAFSPASGRLAQLVGLRVERGVTNPEEPVLVVVDGGACRRRLSLSFVAVAGRSGATPSGKRERKLGV